MKLYKKSLSIILLIFFLSIIITNIFFQTYTIKKFNEIESKYIVYKTDKLLKLINRDIKTTYNLNKDYAIWDDTYKFINNKNNEYMEHLLNKNSIFPNFNIDLILITDKNTNLVFEKYYNNVKKLNKQSIKYISNIAISNIKNKDNPIKGLLKLENSLFLITSVPVTDSLQSKPPNGSMVFIKFLTKENINKICTDNIYTDNILEIIDYKNLSNIIYKKNNITIVENNDDLIEGYGALKDAFGNNSFMLKLNGNRNIYFIAKQNIKFFISIILILGVFMSLLFMKVLNHLVLKRIKIIERTLNYIGTTSDLSIRLDTNGNDEITSLNKNFNKLFDILQKSKEKNLQLAYYDCLTGLSNRKKIIETINNYIHNFSYKKFAILFIDLDHFKSINDTLGHDVGDYVLGKVSGRFKMLLGPNIKIGRLGGDEFIILQDITTISDAEKLACKVCTILNHPIKYNETDLFIGASIGISIYPEDGRDTSTLMKNADTAMYAAKKNGGYKYEVYSRSMHETALNDLMLENRLRLALNRNELLVYFQPIYHLKTSKIVGMESLVRWKFDNKIITPNEFIPLAKNIGEIANIDNWVLKTACAQCNLWQHKNNSKLYISANISFKQMKDKNFVDNVLNTLKSTKLDPKYLCLEITEDEAMEDVGLSIKTLNALKKHGIKISLDDFGTGYSSLSYVTKLPIDNIKIDKSIIKNIHKDNKSLQIVNSIILMAKNLDINIIAEGVENIAQLKVLQKFNCDFIQGFYISKPLPIKSFENYFIK